MVSPFFVYFLFFSLIKYVVLYLKVLLFVCIGFHIFLDYACGRLNNAPPPKMLTS